MLQAAPPSPRESSSVVRWTGVTYGVDVTKVKRTGPRQPRAGGQLGPPQCHRRAERRPPTEPSGAFAAARRRGSQRRPGHAPCCRSCRSPRQSPRSACRRCLPILVTAVPNPAHARGWTRTSGKQCGIASLRGSQCHIAWLAAPVQASRHTAPQASAARRGAGRRGATRQTRQPEATIVAASIGVEVAGGAAVVNLRSGGRPCRAVNGALSTAGCRQCAIADP
jgi:hypothetical protein